MKHLVTGVFAATLLAALSHFFKHHGLSDKDLTELYALLSGVFIVVFVRMNKDKEN